MKPGDDYKIGAAILQLVSSVMPKPGEPPPDIPKDVIDLLTRATVDFLVITRTDPEEEGSADRHGLTLVAILLAAYNLGQQANG